MSLKNTAFEIKDYYCNENLFVGLKFIKRNYFQYFNAFYNQNYDWQSR